MVHISDDTLNEYLDGVLDEVAYRAAQEHLAGCPDCRQRLEALGQLFTALAGLPEAALAADLSGRVVAQLAAAARPWPVPAWLRLALAVQSASALVMLAVLWPTAWARLAEAGRALPEVLALLPAWSPAALLESAGAEIARLDAWLQTIRPETTLPATQLLLLAGLALLAWLAGNGLLLTQRGNRR
ncbi:MAG: zf-HC2 domain-containing protein [Chloroflexi bacterium]|nr:zf-HC2 domain-containing protein [Chloroflexota bacterium]MCI0574599.1 zf-HC2 domain-containing protein [Chloroflexota bacterium]MCI0644049.1 zf-HC2 domain-containing protein [Chloroflexota bacterium]MCI0731723.1 zf-HC2 domain-containing protein [Chloroflexota bacterium]